MTGLEGGALLVLSYLLLLAGVSLCLGSAFFSRGYWTVLGMLLGVGLFVLGWVSVGWTLDRVDGFRGHDVTGSFRRAPLPHRVF